MEIADLEYLTLQDVIENRIRLTNGFHWTLDISTLKLLSPRETIVTHNEVLSYYVGSLLHRPVVFQRDSAEKYRDAVLQFLLTRSQTQTHDEMGLYKSVLTSPSADPRIGEIGQWVVLGYYPTLLSYSTQQHDVSEGIMLEHKLEIPSDVVFEVSFAKFVVVTGKNCKKATYYFRNFATLVHIRRFCYQQLEFLALFTEDEVILSCCLLQVDENKQVTPF